MTPDVLQQIRILVIEDDASLNEIMTTRLTQDGYQVTSAFSGSEGKLLLQRESFDLVITDLMLPGAGGDEVVTAVRQASSLLPIIVVSARNATSDKVDLLSLGADDYLAKPFDLDELSVRVQVQLRHGAQATTGDVQASRHNNATIILGGMQLNMAARTVCVESCELDLTRTEYDIFELLATHPKQVFTKQAIYEQVWGEPYYDQESTVSAHVSNLRSKLKASGVRECIQTVWGIGFRFVVPEAPDSLT